MKWTLRIGLFSLAVLIVSGILVFRKYLPEIVGRKLVDADMPEGVEVNQLGPGKMVMDNLILDYGAAIIEIPSLTATYSKLGIATKEISEVNIDLLTARVNLNAAIAAFTNEPEIMDVRTDEQVAGNVDEETVNIQKLTVKNGRLILSHISLPTMDLPFLVAAQSKGDDVYVFEGRLSPENYPIHFSGELNCLTGNGKIEATANALEMEQWLKYLLPSEARTWAVSRLSAKTDLRVSALFENYSLVWAHFDCETAGMDGKLSLPQTTPAQDAGPAAESAAAELTVHSARLLADVVPPDNNQSMPQITYSLDLKQGRFNVDGYGTGCQLLNLKGAIGRNDSGQAVHSLDGEMQQPLLMHGEDRIQAPRAILKVPSFANTDTMRWSADIENPTARLNDVVFAGQSLSLSGSLIDIKVKADEWRVKGRGLDAKLDLETRVSPAGYLGTLGKGRLYALVFDDMPILHSPLAFTFERGANGIYRAVFPEIIPAGIPDSRLLSLQASLGNDRLTVHGKVEMGSGAVDRLTGWPGRLKEPVHGTIQATCALQAADGPDIEVAATFSKQFVEISDGSLSLQGTVGGRIVAATGVVPSVSADFVADNLMVRHKGQVLRCGELQLKRLSIKPGEKKNKFFAQLFETPVDLRYAGVLSANDIQGESGFLGFRQVRLVLPFVWKGETGFAPLPSAVAETIEVSAGQFSAGKVVFIPELMSLELDRHAIRFQCRFADQAASVQGAASANVTFGGETGALLRLRLDCPQLSTVGWLPGAIPFPSLQKLKLSGETSFETSLFVDRVSVSGTASLMLANVNASLPGVCAVEGLASTLKFREVLPLATHPAQKVGFNKLTLGNLHLNEGMILFQLPGTGGLYLEKVVASWCRGRLQTQGIALKPGMKELDIDIVGENLRLGEALASQKAIPGRGTGRFNARLPLKIQKDQITSPGISIYSSPGRGGRLELQDPDRFFRLLGMTPPSEKKYLQAFAGLDYTSWRLEVAGGSEPLLSFQLVGTPVAGRRPKPIQFTWQHPLPSADLLISIPALFAEPPAGP